MKLLERILETIIMIILGGIGFIFAVATLTLFVCLTGGWGLLVLVPIIGVVWYEGARTYETDR